MVYYSSLLQVRGDFINNKEGGLNLEFGILDLKGNLHNNTGIYTGSDMYTQFTRQEGWQQIYTESPATVKFENLGIYIQGANQYDVFVHTNDGNGYYIKDAANALAEHCYNFGCSGNSCDDCKAKQRKKIWTNLYWPANLPKFPDALENELEIPEMPEMPEMPEIPTVEDLKTRYFGFNGVYSPTGNYSTSFTDMTVPTILGDLTFTRTYNSLDYKISNVGKGFTFSYDMKMEFLKDTISIIMPNPFGGKIHEVTDVTGNQFTYTYDEINMQTTITDRNGRSTVQGYGYDLAVSWTRNELGLTERVTYSQDDGQNKYNEVESSTDVYGNTTKYERDSKGNVIKITYPDGSVERFGFDSLNNMISHTDRNNDTTWYVYDGYYLQKEIRPLDGVSEYSEYADQNNYAIMEYIYDPNAVKKGSVQKIYNELNDAYNYTAYEYNEIGEISCETRYIDGIAYSTQYFYDNVHRLTKQIDPDGTVTEYVYNLAGEVIRTTVTNGSVVSVNRTVYDELGRKFRK